MKNGLRIKNEMTEKELSEYPVLDGEIMAPYSGKYQLCVKAVIPKRMEKDFKFGEKVKVIIVKE